VYDDDDGDDECIVLPRDADFTTETAPTTIEAVMSISPYMAIYMNIHKSQGISRVAIAIACCNNINME
jgi:hypothetical protein